jgi:hypothetical protein
MKEKKSAILHIMKHVLFHLSLSLAHIASKLSLSLIGNGVRQQQQHPHKNNGNNLAKLQFNVSNAFL